MNNEYVIRKKSTFWYVFPIWSIFYTAIKGHEYSKSIERWPTKRAAEICLQTRTHLTVRPTNDLPIYENFILEEQILEGANLKGANFEGADLKGY